MKGPSVARDYRCAANRYQPTSVRVLFLAESPPAFAAESKQAYFFFEDNPGGDLLFSTIIEAVLGITYRKHGGVRKADLLGRFQSKGYWLMDAVEYPINRIDGKKTPDSKRKAFIDRESGKLLESIAALRAEQRLRSDVVIVLIKNLVYESLAEPLRRAGYRVPQSRAIGFPRYHGDPATIQGIKIALAK